MRHAIVIGLLCSACGFAQVSTTQIQPDCTIPFVLTAAAQVTANYNNLSRGAGGPCISWTISYSSTGFSAISLLVQDAPDSSGAPGSWVSFGGTISAGVNPNTTTTSNTTQLYGYYPWMRVTLTSATGTGTVTGLLYGCKLTGCAGGGSGGGGGASSNVNIAQVAGTATVTAKAGTLAVGGPDAHGAAPTANPVRIAGRDGNGNVFGQIFGTLNAIFSTSSSGNTQVIAASVGKTIYVLKWDATPATPINIQLTQGTGVNCATSNTALTAAYASVAAIAMDQGLAPLVATSGNAVCINLGSAVATTGSIQYAQF